MAKHSIVHVEIPAVDSESASAFYADLFGWNIHKHKEFDYHTFQPEAAPAGGFIKVDEQMGFKVGEVLIYISTEDIEATLAKAESLGGKTLAPRTEIPGVGWFAFFADPTGNRIGLFTDKKAQG
jgi:predicted enzyme related to lactoylglutathione lyase